MRKQKQILTHQKCINSYRPVHKMFLAVVSIAISVAGFWSCGWTVISMGGGEIINFAEIIVSIIVGILFAFVSYSIISTTMSGLKRLKHGDYSILVEKVDGYTIEDSDGITDCYLLFTNNTYQHSVSGKKYATTPLGTSYYLIQINGDEEAFTAFETEKWEIDTRLQHKLKEVAK